MKNLNYVCNVKENTINVIYKFKDFSIMIRNLSLTAFLTIAAMVTDSIEIVIFDNGDWFGNFTFTDKHNRFQYVDTKMFTGNNNRRRFEKSVKENGLTITYEKHS